MMLPRSRATRTECEYSEPSGARMPADDCTPLNRWVLEV
jgi:hypothetical protein